MQGSGTMQLLCWPVLLFMSKLVARGTNILQHTALACFAIIMIMGCHDLWTTDGDDEKCVG